MGGPRAKQLSQQVHLGLGIFGVQSESSVDVDTQVPDLAGDFEIWDRCVSTVAAGRADIYYQGQLDSSQTKIVEIKIPIKGAGSAQYRVKVFVEGQGASEVYDSTLTAASASRSVLTLSSFSSQPTGEKRYHVLVEAYVDSGESLFVGRPFVKQR